MFKSSKQFFAQYMTGHNIENLKKAQYNTGLHYGKSEAIDEQIDKTKHELDNFDNEFMDNNLNQVGIIIIIQI